MSQKYNIEIFDDHAIIKLDIPKECTNCHNEPESGFLFWRGEERFICYSCYLHEVEEKTEEE